MHTANLLYGILFFTVLFEVTVAINSGCPQKNGTCLCDGDRAVLTAAFVVIGGGNIAPSRAITELAIREINANSSFLPSVHLHPIFSYYDKDDRKSVFEAVTRVATAPGLVALFGATSSQASEIVSLVASAGGLPQVSDTAISSTLSNKNQFPTFMRTTIASSTQILACVELLNKYNWREVIVVVDERDLAVVNLKKFLSLAQDSTSAGRPLSIGMQIVIDAGINATEAARRMLSSDIYAVIVFSSLPQFTRLFSHMIYLDPTGARERNFFCFGNTYIISEGPNIFGPNLAATYAAYGMHPNVTIHDFFRHATGLLGLTNPTGNNSRTAQFEEYVRNSNPSDFPVPLPSVISGSSQLLADAIYTFAYGVQAVLANASASNKTACDMFYTPSWDGHKLYAAMRNASFLGTSGPIQFDENGDRLGTVNIINVRNTFDSNGTLLGSTAVVTETWDAVTGVFTTVAPTLWRDGSNGTPPAYRAAPPPPPHADDGDSGADVKAWVPPVAIGLSLLLVMNVAWLARNKHQKRKVWSVDITSIEWGPVKALDCGTSISDAVYLGADVGVRRVPLSRTLLANATDKYCVDAARAGQVAVRSAFRMSDTNTGTIKVNAPKPFFDGDEVHVNVCGDPGRASLEDAIGDKFVASMRMPDGSFVPSAAGVLVDSPLAGSPHMGVGTPRCKQQEGVVPDTGRDSSWLRGVLDMRRMEPPLPREQRMALVNGAEQLLLRTLEMHHPNLERVIGGGVTKGALYIVLERLTGGSLHAAMQNRTLDGDVGVMVGMLLDTASALKYLHSQRPPIVHGDLNPKSLFLDDNMSLKLSVASPFRLLNSSLGRGVVPLTLEYAAPEVLAGRPATPASDVYSFGMMLWECFARADIYADLPLEAIVEGVIMGAVRPKPVPGMPVELEGLMYECLSPWPHRRPTFGEIHARVLSAFRAKGVLQRFSALQSRLEAQEALIDKVMPPHVAEALHRGESVPPERHDCVTIMFSDIVGFTALSAQLLPIEVMQMLDRLYTQFDMLTVRHGLFKVETIGDAYMVVGNLHPKADDHTARIVRFAQDAIEVANTVPVKLDDPTMGTIHIRTGVHVGPVVASVVGTLNPRYCLFGDTVNMTSRIETSSHTDCVHLSRAAATALAAQDASLRTVKRGKVLLKGKGETVTYWLESCVARLPENLRTEMQTDGRRRTDPGDVKELDVSAHTMTTLDSSSRTGRQLATLDGSSCRWGQLHPVESIVISVRQP